MKRVSGSQRCVAALASRRWAKTIAVPKGAIHVNQLHEALLERFPAWRGTEQPDGSFADPLLHVEHDDEEIILTVPDDADEAVVHAAVASHLPRPQAQAPAGRGAETPSSLGMEERVKRLEERLGLGGRQP